MVFFFFQIFNQKIGSDVSQCEKIPPVTAGSEDGAIHAGAELELFIRGGHK
jgi:hypothetical protein